MATSSRHPREAADDVTETRPRVVAPAKRPAFRAGKGRSWGRIVFVLVLLGVAALVVMRQLRPKPVTTSEVVRGTAVEAVYATGAVEAVDRATVKAKVGGSILELLVREGARVKKGDLLARIDSPALKFDLAKGKADLWAASSHAGTNSAQLAALDAQAKVTEAQLKTAREDRDRLTKLVAAGTSTQVELDKATNQVAALEAQLAAQAAQRAALKIDLAARASGSSAAVDTLSARLTDTEVRAPLDGVVLMRAIELGEVVMVNQALFRIGTVDNLVLECPIDEADIGKVTIGMKAAISLYAFSGQAFKGEVVEIMPDADRTKKSFLTKVKLLDPPSGLRSGMSAEVNIVIEERPNSLLAPSEAIDANGFAWVIREGRATKRQLQLGVRDMLRVEIKGGVVAGEQLVVIGGDGLKEGAKVTATVKPVDMAMPRPTRPKAGL